MCSTFLDVALKIPYLAALGINVLQPLPIDEQEANPNMGYGGADLFSPDFPYIARRGPAGLSRKSSTRSTRRSKSQASRWRISSPDPGSSRRWSTSVMSMASPSMFDVVYNHAGGFSVDGQFDDNCLYYMDRRTNRGDNNDSLYFTDQDRGTGGLAFALWNDDVAKFLLDNARYFLEEFHADGFRYDEISTLISTGQGSGWEFCRALTSNLARLSQPHPAERGILARPLCRHSRLRRARDRAGAKRAAWVLTWCSTMVCAARCAARSARRQGARTRSCRCRRLRRRFIRPVSTTAGAR